MTNRTITFSKLLVHGLIALACALAFLAPARAASVVPLYLDEIIDTATVAFEGTCLGNRSERDPLTNLVVTYTTFSVREVLKGGVGTTYTIKQIGGSLPDDNIRYRVEGVPKFTAGEDYVVFLAGVSAAGFSSPIGLAQGRFRVEGAPAARKVANGRDFKDLTARMSSHVPQRALDRMVNTPGAAKDMDLDDFKALVRAHTGGRR